MSTFMCSWGLVQALSHDLHLSRFIHGSETGKKISLLPCMACDCSDCHSYIFPKHTSYVKEIVTLYCAFNIFQKAVVFVIFVFLFFGVFFLLFFLTPTEVGNILSWRLIMKYFLRSFSPFR